MERITIEELMEKLNKFKNNNILTKLEGDIETSIDMKFNEAKIICDYFEITYNKSKYKISGQKLKIDFYKIRNIESNKDTEFYIYLDGEQKIIIFTNMHALIRYEILKWREREILSDLQVEC